MTDTDTEKEMDSKTLSTHKAELLKIQRLLKKAQDLPTIEHALYNINKVLRAIKNYERWRINKTPWDGSFGIRDYCVHIAEMRFTSYDDKKKNKALGVGTDKEYLEISFCGRSNIFCSYPDLTKEFFDKAVEMTKPYYVDNERHELFYTEENACEANDIVASLYKEYKGKYHQREKERKIQELKERLAEMEGQNGK